MRTNLRSEPPARTEGESAIGRAVRDAELSRQLQLPAARAFHGNGRQYVARIVEARCDGAILLEEHADIDAVAGQVLTESDVVPPHVVEVDARRLADEGIAAVHHESGRGKQPADFQADPFVRTSRPQTELLVGGWRL